MEGMLHVGYWYVGLLAYLDVRIVGCWFVELLVYCGVVSRYVGELVCLGFSMLGVAKLGVWYV